MRVFVTGATGFIGSAVVKDLLGAGHQVIGLTRSDAGEKQLITAGAQPHRGSLEDPASLRTGAEKADGVIHLAFMHAFGDAKLSSRLGVLARGLTGGGVISSFMKVMMGADAAAIDAMGSVLAGSGKPFVITVGTMGMKPGQLALESDSADPASVGAARSVPSEKAALALAARGVRTSVLRLPPSVHGDGDEGFIPRLIDIARKKGESAYIDDGANRWPAVHRLDAARLYRLALENAPAGSRYHAIADEGVTFREVAEVIGKRLNVPVVSKSAKAAAGQFSFLAPFVATDNPASGQWTQKQLDWHPTQASLISDIDRPVYFQK